LVSFALAWVLGTDIAVDECIKRRAKLAIFCGICGVVCTLGLGGIISIVVTLLYAIFVNRTGRIYRLLKRPVVWLTIMLIPLVFFTVIVPGARERVRIATNSSLDLRILRLASGDSDSGYNGRLALWQLAMERAFESPVFGTARQVMSDEIGWGNPGQAGVPVGGHNVYVFTAYTQGFIAALALLTAVLVGAYRSRRRAQPLNAISFTHQLAYAGHLLIVNLAIGGLGNDWTMDPGIGFLFWLSMGYGAAISGYRGGHLHTDLVTAFELPGRRPRFEPR
jgi:O-antigen ligase